MMPDLVDINPGKQLAVILVVEGELPVLDLGVARKQQADLYDPHQQDDAGIVHRLVEHAHDLQQVVTAYVTRMIVQPPGADRKTRSARALMFREKYLTARLGRAGGVHATRLKLPKLVGIPGPLLLDGRGLLDRRG